MNNNIKILPNDKMEGYIFLYINLILQYQKKYLVLDNFALYIYSSEEFVGRKHEYSFHVKFLEIDYKQGEKMIYLTYFKKKVYIKTNSIEEFKNWINVIQLSQTKYNRFFSNFYQKSDTIIEFGLDFDNILNTISLVEENLSNLVINYDMETFLNKNYLLKKKINDYLKEISIFYYNLDETNKQELWIKNKVKEIKSLLIDTNVYKSLIKDILNKFTHGLSIGDIKLYIIGFCENLKKKVRNFLITRSKSLYN